MAGASAAGVAIVAPVDPTKKFIRAEGNPLCGSCGSYVSYLTQHHPDVRDSKHMREIVVDRPLVSGVPCRIQ
jgi:hypothetical protein